MTLSQLIKGVGNPKWGKWLVIVLGIVLLLSAPVRCDGPYKGRVVEEATGRPISGVVAVATWSTKSINIAGGTTHCVDAAEAVTDESGRFEIAGRKASLFGTLGTMQIHIYKVGYRRVECMWQYLGDAGSCYADKPVEFDRDRAVFPLRRVSKDRLLEEGSPPHVSCGRKDGKPLTEYIKADDEYSEVYEQYRRSVKKRP
jgi:hypothetical protein